MSNDKILIPRSVAKALWGNGPLADDDHPGYGGWEQVHDECYEETRWGARYELVVSAPDGQFYMTFYETHGDNGPDVWDDEPEVEFHRVVRREVMTVEYVSPAEAAS